MSPADGDPAAGSLQLASDQDTPAKATAHYAFPCRVCGTRLTVTTDQAGAPVSCPDCLEETVAPRPPSSAPASTTTTVVGDELSLQDDQFHRPRFEPLNQTVVTRDAIDSVQPSATSAPQASPASAAADDAQDPGSAGAAKSPKAPFTFPCPVCGTSLMADAARVGERIQCGDCETETPIPQPPRPTRPTPSGQAEDRETWHEFQLSQVEDRPTPHQDLARAAAREAMDRAEEAARKRPPGSAPARRPPNTSSPATQRAAAQRPAKTPPPVPSGETAPPPGGGLSLDAGPPGDASPSLDAGPSGDASPSPPPPPTPPAPNAAESLAPLADDQLAQAPELPSIGRFITQPAVGGMLLMLSIWWTVELLILYASAYTQQLGGLYSAMSLLCWVCFVALGAPVLMYSCAAALAVVEQVANGSDEVTATLAGWYDEYVSNVVFVAGSFLLALVPGGMLRYLAGSLIDHWWWSMGVLVGGVGLMYPIILLSGLEQGTLAPPVSRLILTSVSVARKAWMRFYLESLILLTPLLIGMSLKGVYGVLVAGPLLAVTFLTYFWRLGVLGRRCEEVIRNTPHESGQAS